MSNMIILPIHWESTPADQPKLNAFAFTRDGKLLSRQEVTGDTATFNDLPLPGNELRYFILPAGDVRIDQATTIDELLKFQPYEPVVNWQGKEAQLLPIPDRFPQWWKWIFCRVTGRVTKRFNLLGRSEEKPLCRARVHICEVDRILFWLPRIPDHIILRIPDIILRPEVPVHIPLPTPDPGPLRLTTTALRPTLNPFKPLAINDITVPKLRAQPTLDKAVVKALSSGSADMIRKTVEANLTLFHPYFCLYPWIWPWLYRCDELKTVYTDLNGRFDTNITYLAGGDIPDLYFWVEYQVNGVWTTVYKPGVPCNTWWDYRCGTDVTLRVTDERVRWECQNILPGELVWIKTVGDGASVSRIRQSSFLQAVPNNTAPDPVPLTDRLGMSDASVSDAPTAAGDFKRPFGGTLSFRTQFSSDIRNTGAVYYKWKWCKTHMADLTPLNTTPAETDFHYLHDAVNKAYSFEFLDVFNIKHIGYNSVALGPKTVGTVENLYIVPPVNPAMAPFNVPESAPQWNQDTDSISFDSNGLNGDGVYEFRMELYDAAGQLLTVDQNMYQVPDAASFAPSVSAPTSMLVNYNPGTHTTTGFALKLRINNQPTQAAVYKLNLNGVPSSPSCCGFVNYGSTAANIEIGFKAYHPEGLAEFSFVVTKGTCTDDGVPALTNASGFVNIQANHYQCDANGHYTKTFHPNDLLGSCAAEAKAAYAETLNVYALAINGSSRLSNLDSSGIAAFALEP